MAAVAQLFAVAALLSSPAPTSPGLRIAWSDASSGELWIARGDGRLRTKIDTLFWPGGVPGAFGTPAWSPSGSRLAYWASPKPHVQVLRVNRLRGARYVETWSRGDGSVFFVVGRKTKPRTLMRASGRSAPVDETNWPGEPLWSADGSHLAFFRLDGHLEVVDVRTGRSRLIRTRRLADGWVYSLTVSLSPDGRHAVVVNTGHGGAWIADLRDGSLRRFAPRGARIGEAAWSPDGKWLAYTRGDARGNGQLLAASVDARRVIRLTNDVPRDPFSHFSNTSPAWSPDGTKVAFLSNRDGRSDHELFVVGTDGRGDRRLTHGLFVTPPLRWSSDSRRIAFVGWGDPYLGVVGAGGSPVSRLARQPSDGYGYLAPFDFSWVGRPVTPGRLPQPRSAAPHRIRAVRDHAPIGSARVGERRRIARLALWSRLADLSPDGSLVSFVHTRGGHGFEVGVRSIVTGVSRIVVRSEALWPYDEEGIFSRDGRELLFRRWDRLMAFDLSSGRTRTLAVRVPQRPYFALDGRSVAYVSSGGRVAVVEPGRTPHPIAVRLHPDAAYAPSPDGARVLYESAGRTWLLDRKNGRRRVIAVGLPPQLGSWSPDGRRFALAGTFPGCGAPDTILFDRDGRRLGNLLGLRVDGTEGASMRWSTDGRRLIVLPFYGGTRPPPQPLFSYSRATGRASLVLVGAQTPLVGPGGWTVFTRGNALWLGRISGR